MQLSPSASAASRLPWSSSLTGPAWTSRRTAGPPATVAHPPQPAWPVGTYCRSAAYAEEMLWRSHVT
eukprot:1380136-Pyramimonas_sp.AAC.1